jgi:hypothetical protein
MTSEELQRVEEAIVLVLLDSEHPERWTFPELEAKLDHHEGLVLRHAAAELAGAGVVVIDGEELWAAPPARHLDSLGMIAV